MIIGIVDSEIDSDSPEFVGRLHPSSADVVRSRGLDNPDSDHGTNVAMVAAAARDNTGIMGVAWNAQIAMYRADTVGTCADPDPDKGCTFNDNAIAAGVDRAVAAGAKVINLSLGGSPPNGTLAAAVARAAAAGVVIVVSAGNNGNSTDPADDPNNPDPMAAGLRQVASGNVIIAGSVNDQGVFSAFSNRAGTEQTWFLSALGERVCCVYENGVLKIQVDPDGSRFQFVFSGTSFSAPHIAGAAALLFQAFPNLNARQVVDLLLRTARDAGAAGTDSTYGRGILDLANAFAPQGTTSLASSKEPLPLGDTSIATSPAMGDAGKKNGPLGAIILDGYQRAYELDLRGTLRGAQVIPKLANALTGQRRQVRLGAGDLALGFTVDGRGQVSTLPWQGRLRLSRADAVAAEVLAARVMARIAPGTRLGVAYRQGSDGLVAQLQGANEPAFLVATSPLDDYGFGRDDETALALRHQLGKWGLTFSADLAQARSGAPLQRVESTVERRGRGATMRYGLALDRSFGDFGAALGATWLSEQRTVLGARLHNSLGSRGANSVFLDASLAWKPAPQWRFGGYFRRGYTAARSGGMLAAGSDLSSTAWAFDVSRYGLFQQGDSLAFRLSQPLRVDSGGIELTLPVAYSYETLAATLGNRRLSLSPAGRERIAELAWHGTLWQGAASVSLFYRTDPGHYADLPDDKGVALTWARKF